MSVDLWTRIAPWAQAVSGVANLTNGVASPILAASATGLIRYLLGFSTGNTTCPISLNFTVGGTELGRVYAPTQTVQIVLTRQITTPANGLSLIAQGVNSGAVSYTLWYADTPPNILSDVVLNGVVT